MRLARGALSFVGLAVATCALIACAGRSVSRADGSGSGTTGGDGISCTDVDCSPGTGGTTRAAGGTTGSGGTLGTGSGGTLGTGSGGTLGTGFAGALGAAGGVSLPPGSCEYNGNAYSHGSSWPVECNSCVCDNGEVSCTSDLCSGGNGGNGGSAGAGPLGAGRGGMAGNGFFEESCAVELGQICIEGTKVAGGHELTEGMPLVFTVRPYGCYSEGCIEGTRSSCSVIGTGQTLFVAGFACTQRNRNECGACVEGPASACKTDKTLSAGDYSIAVAGTGSGTYTALSFTVPSIVSDADRCTRYLL